MAKEEDILDDNENFKKHYEELLKYKKQKEKEEKEQKEKEEKEQKEKIAKEEKAEKLDFLVREARYNYDLSISIFRSNDNKANMFLVFSGVLLLFLQFIIPSQCGDLTLKILKCICFFTYIVGIVLSDILLLLCLKVRPQTLIDSDEFLWKSNEDYKLVDIKHGFCEKYSADMQNRMSSMSKKSSCLKWAEIITIVSIIVGAIGIILNNLWL